MEKNADLRSDFYLNPDVTFLNFGSFGACPKPLMEDLWKWQLMLERDPVKFIAEDSLMCLKNSRESLADYIGCDADDLVYVPNPSYAMNIIAKSIQLKPGDEILSTGIEYGAMDRTWNYYCRRSGAKFVRQHINLPVESKERFMEDFWKGYNSNTKAIFISHITSSTALILPVKEICEEAKKRGLLTIVDGAHVPGHIPLDLRTIDVDIYTGACHKWMMTPKGCSFLYVKKEQQKWVDPLVISWGYESAMPSHSQFLDYHQTQGTRDISSFLTVPAAIEYMKKHRWNEVAITCAKLARANYQRFCDLLGTKPLCPVDETFLGQMCSMSVNTDNPFALKKMLYDKYKIEIPVMPHDGKVFIRYSINVFNSQQDLDKLYDALSEIKDNKTIY